MKRLAWAVTGLVSAGLTVALAAGGNGNGHWTTGTVTPVVTSFTESDPCGTAGVISGTLTITQTYSTMPLPNGGFQLREDLTFAGSGSDAAGHTYTLNYSENVTTNNKVDTTGHYETTNNAPLDLKSKDGGTSFRITVILHTVYNDGAATMSFYKTNTVCTRGPNP